MKSHRVSLRTFTKKSLGEISDFYFSPRKIFFHARGVPQRNAKKELFSWADLYVKQRIHNGLKIPLLKIHVLSDINQQAKCQPTPHI